MGQEVIFTSSQPMSIIPLDVHKLGNFQYLQFTTVTRKHVPYCLFNANFTNNKLTLEPKLVLDTAGKSKILNQKSTVH